MARSSRAAVALLLVGCLLATALAAPPHRRSSRRSEERELELEEETAETYEADEAEIEDGVEARGDEKPGAGGLYECPDVPKMKGCARNGCIMHTKRHATYLICNECANEKAYVLQHAGTRKAVCECAPGFAGRGQDGQCKRCPENTDLAIGGPIRTSVCLRCPKGTIVSEDGTDCLCPAGMYRAVVDQAAGFKRVACKACEARNAYVSEELHAKESCSMCRIPQLANKDHTKCVDSQSPDAAEMPEGILKSVAARADSTFGGLASAFEEGRQLGAEQRTLAQGEETRGPGGLFKGFTKRVGSLTKSVEQRLGGGGAAKKAPAPAASTKKDARKAEAEEADAREEREQEALSRSSAGGVEVEPEAEAEASDDEALRPVVGRPSESKVLDRASERKARRESRKEAKQAAKEETSSLSREERREAKKDRAEAKADAKKDKVVEHHDARAALQRDAAMDNSKAANPALARSLIPGLPVAEGDDKAAEAKMKETIDKELAAGGTEGPKTIKDMARSLGAQLGMVAPSREYVDGLMGKIDPEALKDAGLPPADNMASLVGALVKRQFADLDTSDWAQGVRSIVGDRR